ncbi:DDE-type integrase/transposase/recombinase [uncultured Roseobacter sp.]|uniref:DDE-type integrase/transposase/recombinase n=1 Tax=uncultured Roseobacter sp. TaxID=114847 RepID=UPI00344F9BF6
MLAERGISVDPATINRRVIKFRPEIARRSFSRRGPRGFGWHVDETYVRVGGKWRYLWKAVDQSGKVIDFRLTARIYGPMSITTDKAPTYSRVIGEMNTFCFPGEEIIHVDRKWRNNRIESDHAALKRITDPGRGFQSLRTDKATLKGIDAVGMIKRGHVCDPPTNA